jgi:acyl dehydratase
MALDAALVGKPFPAAEPYQVGREKIREFASAIGDANPAYHDLAAARALGYSDLVAPPTFGFILQMQAMNTVLFDPSVGVELSRVIHGEQKFDYVRPIVAGDEIVVRPTIEEVKSRPGMDMITVRGDLTDASGAAVGTLRSVIVHRTIEG